MPVAADLLRDARDRQRLRVVVGAKRGEQLLDAGAVLVNERALGAALFALAEDVERGAAQALEPRQQFEQRQRRRAEAALLQLALFVALGQQRRRQVVGFHWGESGPRARF